MLAELLSSDCEQLHLVLVVHELGSDPAELLLPLIDLGHVGACLEPVLLHEVFLVVGEPVDLLLHLIDLPALLLREAYLLGECLLATLDLVVLVIHLGLEVIVLLS